ncbi:hypothetical protein SFOMI_3386 [Sphingobium fuliginis]|uniref:Uncharacterized protein n=2 Tax=Sphingobium fuliginis (strain ATCC 27551) TaxID=336203 RepID=A0A292ZIU2_SPHSA|nr:hypothetical protein SFOMI_3386 [Sphingobium fuliginis]
MARNPLWIAQRHGQDWNDAESIAAIEWMVAQAPPTDWQSRLDRVSETFFAARDRWAAGDRIALFDPSDLIAWYVFQGTAYATASERRNWVEHEAFRIAPVFRRLGQLLPDLRKVSGVEQRVATLMSGGRSTPDNGIYELLVAGAYARRGWRQITFVPEQPGVARTPDLDVRRGRSRWAVECKRVGQSEYSALERDRADLMSGLAHAVCERAAASLDIKIAYLDELSRVDEAYLANHVAAFLDGGPPHWKDAFGEGFLAHIDRAQIDAVLRHDDVYFGSSRMIELLIGDYHMAVDYDVRGDWEPSAERPFHATTLGRVSVVSWLSVSDEAARRKARHFRSMVSGAASQLPGDCPGVVHVGYETTGGNSVDGRRHGLNLAQIATFQPGASRLQWVYGNYMTPEHSVDRNESAALSETTAIYPVRGRRNTEPLPNHMLFMDEDGDPGYHWHR